MPPSRKPSPIEVRNRLIEHSIRAMANARAEMANISNHDLLESVHLSPTYRLSAHNLLHYLALRHHDLRALQKQLTDPRSAALKPM